MASAQPLLAEEKASGVANPPKKRVSKYLVEPTQCDLNGLTTAKAEELLKKHGYNELAEKERNKLWEFLKHFWGPMPIMIWLAVGVEAIQGDTADMLVLLTLQVINGTVGWYEESKAGDAIAALKNSLAPKCSVKRDGRWETMAARQLVPSDIVKLALGCNVPADCMVLDGKPISVDQSAMTGESLPVTMRKGDTAKMGSNVVAGEIEACVVATGSETFFGKTAAMINSVEEEGHFQKIIWSITLFLLGVSFLLVAFIMAVMLIDGSTFLETLSICVVLLVASIPIAMQVVCTSTMALGSHELAKKNAIVSRLAAIEEIAGMDMLCSDKTGTLTLNKMTLQERKPFSNSTEKSLLLYAMLGTQWTETAKDAIDTMLFAARQEVEEDLKKYVGVDYVPFDPSVKRTEGTVHPANAPSQKFKVTKGAPNVICDLAHNAAEIREKVEELVDSYASRGIRCLGIAYTDSSGQWSFAGMLTFVDPPRPDTKEVIHKAMELGVGVKMITGDHVAIAKETCRMLGLGTTVLSNKDIEAAGNRLGDLAEGCDGFAGVFPEHKFDIVNALRGNGWLCGMTGDGVNDAPALKRADIGIAVEGATDAARAAADIVLVSPGLSVIIDAIDLARQIFQRMKNYITYRIACTLQLLVFFFLTVLFVKPRDIMQDDAVPQYFALPVMAMVLITILNDGTIISIAYDHVVPGSTPEKWNLPLVIAVAICLGAVACASSILMLYLCLFSHEGDSIFNRWFGAHDLTYLEIRCIIYLKVSISDFLTVFSARTQGPFFERRPGKLLFGAAVFATAVSTLLAHYWPFEEMSGITWRWCGITWGYCVAWWLVQDLCKVLLVRALHTTKVTQDDKAKKQAVKKMRQSLKVELGKEGIGASDLRRGEGLTKAQVVARIETLESELKALKIAVAKLN
uniref:Plasma membrane ATPase n=1 Tax=Alexandrium catenella TaxID=2925 RepID=A0A7S1WBI6_ALECA